MNASDASESGSDGDTFVDPETGEVGHIIRNPFGVANPEGVDTGIDIPDDAGEEVGGIITSPFGVPASDDIDTGVNIFDEDEEYLISLPDDEESEVEESENVDEVDDETSDDGKEIGDQSEENTTEKYIPVKDNPIPNREWDDFYIMGTCGSNSVISFTDNPGENETLFVPAGQTFTISVFPQDFDWPPNTLTWNIAADINNPLIPGISDINAIQVPNGKRKYTFPTAQLDKYGKYVITVSSSLAGYAIPRKINIYVFTLEIGKAIRRGNPADDWNNNRFLLYTPDSHDFKLSLEKKEVSSIGDCVFLPYPNNAATPEGKNMDIRTTRGLNTYYIKGVIESCNEKDIILKIKNQNGNSISERFFIVYSKFDDPVFSEHTPDFFQHKDTLEGCDYCEATHYQPPIPLHQVSGIHSDDSDCAKCDHCMNYCARACLKVMCGLDQDYYKRLDTLSQFNPMNGNHSAILDISSIVHYLWEDPNTWIFNAQEGRPVVYINSYYQVYNLFYKHGKYKQIGGMISASADSGHAFIVYGCHKNTKGGEITGYKVHIWNPFTCSTSYESISILRVLFVPPSWTL